MKRLTFTLNATFANVIHTLLITTCVFFSGSSYTMEPDALNLNINAENQIQITQLFPKEIVIHIAGYCWSKEKNALMKVCKLFHTWLKDRILIVQANPTTVNFNDKIKEMFYCAFEHDSKNLFIWTQSLNPSDVNRKNILGLTPIHIASNDKSCYQWLAENGADVNTHKPQIPPLHEAVYKGDTQSVHALLATKKINLKLTIGWGVTPLYIAAHEGNIEIIELLLAHGADINQIDSAGCTLLYIASRMGQTRVVRLLLAANGINVNQANEYGATPLIIASVSGHTEVVRLLLTQDGININQTDNYLFTPLFSASDQDCAEVVRLLLTANEIDINQATKGGWTPLYSASRNGRIEIVQLLLNAGANANQTNPSGTPLYDASEKGHIEVVRLLLNAGAYVNQLYAGEFVALYAGFSPLLIASKNGHAEIVRLLLKAGANASQSIAADRPADPSLKKDDTALQIAQRKGHNDIVALLKPYYI